MLKIAVVRARIAVCNRMSLVSCELTVTCAKMSRGSNSMLLCALQLINSRAAMLGFALAIIGYQTTGKNVW